MFFHAVVGYCLSFFKSRIRKMRPPPQRTRAKKIELGKCLILLGNRESAITISKLFFQETRLNIKLQSMLSDENTKWFSIFGHLISGFLDILLIEIFGTGNFYCIFFPGKCETSCCKILLGKRKSEFPLKMVKITVLLKSSL